MPTRYNPTLHPGVNSRAPGVQKGHHHLPPPRAPKGRGVGRLAPPAPRRHPPRRPHCRLPRRGSRSPGWRSASLRPVAWSRVHCYLRLRPERSLASTAILHGPRGGGRTIEGGERGVASFLAAGPPRLFTRNGSAQGGPSAGARAVRQQERWREKGDLSAAIYGKGLLAPTSRENSERRQKARGISSPLPHTPLLGRWNGRCF